MEATTAPRNTMFPRWTPTPEDPAARLRACGKFLFLGDRKVCVKGVTYGPFAPPGHPGEYGHPLAVERDLAVMKRHGVNALRTYGTPPLWLLDAAMNRGIRVMVGLAWEQHVAFLEDRKVAGGIRDRMRRDVAEISGHPAILAYALGNEIPSPIVRWHGRRRVASFLQSLWETVKEEDPGGLVTYVNYPTTEHLELPFLDLLAFNVYLEKERDLRSYVARLQNLAGDRPLVLAELGLDARAHGEGAQARALDWQIRTAFEGGCAGAFVFSWTDQWHRGGQEVVDWSFGLTTRERRPRPALRSVRQAFESDLSPDGAPWPRVSVVVCSYNGASTLEEALQYVERLRYPDYEVIVVDDGSSDRTAEVAGRFDVRLISTPNRGLSSARNTGLAAATGEIVAYLDDDAFPDRDWLRYLALAFQRSDHVGVGGPNVPPPDEGPIARCVARAPGGPIHVLLSDTEAEHLPGCNMAFRVDRLREIGGFDPQFRAAGDDVDVCWRLIDEGGTLGFSPGAMVWHRRRASIRGYWKQQRGYGRAEGVLEQKWPDRYNAAGHVSWTGRMYGGGAWPLLIRGRDRIYQGTWGTAPFQSVDRGPPAPAGLAAVMPEAWLVLLVLMILTLLGTTWSPLLVAAGAALVLLAAMTSRILVSTWLACRPEVVSRGRGAFLHSFAITALLHFVQPIARLTGRIEAGLAPWRRHIRPPTLARPVGRLEIWSEEWRPADEWCRALENRLHREGLVVRRGGEYDRWDLAARSGPLGSTRILAAVEEHGHGRQLVRLRLRRTWSDWLHALWALPAGLSVLAGLDGAWFASGILGAAALGVLGRAVSEHLCTVGVVRSSVKALETEARDAAAGARREKEAGAEEPDPRRREGGLARTRAAAGESPRPTTRPRAARLRHGSEAP
jgi:O-antigen biosynthesis protein